MAIDMKKKIAEAVVHLLFEKHAKKLTVKDIVEECHITRQAFYYHFADIPELLRWMVQQRSEEFLEEISQLPSDEESIKYWFLMFASMRESMQKGLESNYGQELEKIIFEHMLELFRHIAEKREDLQQCDAFERELLIRYHCFAVMGILVAWTEEDNENIDRIVHDVFLIVSGHVSELSEVGRKLFVTKKRV